MPPYRPPPNSMAHEAAHHPTGPHTHVHDGVVHVHDTRADAWIFWTFVFGAATVQVLVFLWKRRSPKTFGLVTTGALWMFPLVHAVYLLSVRFIITWGIFSLATGYVVRLALRKPLLPSTPRKVFRFFDVAFRTSSAVAVCSYVVMIGLVMAVPHGRSDHLPAFLLDTLLVGMLYGIYFGVLTRDVADVVSEHIAVSIGYRKKDDDDSAKPVPQNVCALCSCELRPDSASSIEEGTGGEGAASLAAVLAAPAVPPGRQPQQRPRTVRLEGVGGEAIYRLECSHSFHAFCIQGWTLIGKKSTCPCCLERVDLRAVAGASIWAHPSIMWGQLLDAARYAVVWLPIISFVVRFALWEAGLSAALEVAPVGSANASSVLAGLPDGDAAAHATPGPSALTS